MNIKTFIKNRLNNETKRQAFVAIQLSELPNGNKLLDAGCGSQQYRKHCDHLNYKAQDFGQYTNDTAPGLTSGMGGEKGYQYGKLDYIGDIWAIDEENGTFDSILCTEVFEHIPFPNETVREFSRLLKPGGKLILTVPSNCLRHMDPYFFYSGFSNNYLSKILGDSDFRIEQIDAVGDYYSWLAVELARSIRSHPFSALFLAPAFLWYFFKKPTSESRNTLCMGYHVVARKL
jgi:SAM-dependent methyltransferase